MFHDGDVQETGVSRKGPLQSADVHFWETSSNLGSKKNKKNNNTHTKQSR